MPLTHSPEQPPKIEKKTPNETSTKIPMNKIQTISDIGEEKMDLIWVVRVSICNKPIKFLIDCGSHTSMLKSKCLMSNILYYPQIRYCMLRWKLTLAEYDFQIIHRKSTNNVVSDCLSRLEPNTCINVSDLMENTASKAIMQMVTRSRSKENELIGDTTPKMPTFHIREDPGVTMDTEKYNKILFVIDSQECLA